MTFTEFTELIEFTDTFLLEMLEQQKQDTSKREDI